MIDSQATQVGRVRHVLGATVTVALDPEMAGIAPIYRGRLQPIGQIGSLVRIPQGLVDLIAAVTLVGIAELAGPAEPTNAIQTDERWLQVQLLGEIDRSTQQFRRGVGSYPGLDDPVHFATAEDLLAVFPPAGANYIRVGSLSASEEVPVCVDAGKLVVRHAVIVGSTGSGKTSATSSLLQCLVRAGWRAANVVVIDPHGEYASALEANASVRSVLASEIHTRLRIPYWALPANDILTIFTGVSGPPPAAHRFSELVMEERRRYADSAEWVDLNPDAITSDTPIPFDIRAVWYRMDYENRETRQAKLDADSVCLISPGDAASLTGAEFEPYGPGGTPPHQAPTYGLFGATPALLRSGLQDPRLDFLQEPGAGPTDEDPLVEVVQEWLGSDRPISVLDFNGVPARAADAAIGVVLNLLFEVALHSTPEGPGVGRCSPLLVVLEEAHRYLTSQAGALAGSSVNRIAREGRKYGVGLMLVTQRPTELPDTTLAQCGTVIALRLSNTGDQGAIRSALPDTVAGLSAVLPSLRTHEALISGEALVLPVRVCLDKPSPWPHAADPSIEAWRGEPGLVDVSLPLLEWRSRYR